MQKAVKADIEIFIQCVEKYFTKRSSEKLIVETPYLTDDVSRILSEYTGIIKISGAYKGNVYFTAPRGFLEHVIKAHGQNEFSIALLQDAIGEIANTLSGNSRKELGKNFVISVPQVISGEAGPAFALNNNHSFVVPLKWYGYTAALIVSVVNS